jgi:GNAT superfamily N-acetyltransferase
LEETTDTGGFKCNEKEIDDFIHSQALGFQNQQLGVTYLFNFRSDLVGFTTLCMGHINKQKMPSEDRLLKSISSYPALLIGQLGVSVDYQRKGVGKHMCNFCFSMAIRLSQKVGCRFLVVNAVASAVDFYEKYGFTLAPDQEKQKQKLMFLDITKRKTEI